MRFFHSSYRHWQEWWLAVDWLSFPRTLVLSPLEYLTQHALASLPSLRRLALANAHDHAVLLAQLSLLTLISAFPLGGRGWGNRASSQDLSSSLTQPARLTVASLGGPQKLIYISKLA